MNSYSNYARIISLNHNNDTNNNEPNQAITIRFNSELNICPFVVVIIIIIIV